MRLIAGLLWLSSWLPAADIYYLLWFDTEDYVEPKADDAALRIALDLEKMGVRATFKVVGEKARVLEKRGRADVIWALARHDIGYHAENHSIPPPPAMYMKQLGMLEGAEEFERREGQGVRDIRRIFGVTPSCYGQPGSSWGPQSTIALRRLGVPIYMDEGSQVGYEQQPFWYGGILFVFNLQRFNMRAELNTDADVAPATAKFDVAVSELQKRGTGGVIHTYYHPTEFVATEFWDGVNFARGRYTPPPEYKSPQLRTRESSERAYANLLKFMEHVKRTPGIKMVTARELMQIYATPDAKITREEAVLQLRQAIDVSGDHSAADLLVAALGLTPRYVDGPVQRKQSSLTGTAIARELFERGKRDAVNYIERHRRLPSHVWFGSEFLSLPDLAATVAHDAGGPTVTVRQGMPAFEKYIATDARQAFRWAIHPETFEAPELLDLGRLQAWTLKPAKLR